VPKLRYRPDNKTYFIDYILDGKRVRRTLGKNKKIAQLATKEIEVKLAKQQLGFDTVNKPFSAILKEYLEFSEQTKSHATYVRDDCSRLTTFSNYLENPDIPIRKIPQRLVEQYLSHRLTLVKPVTVKGDLKTLKAFFNKAVDWGYLNENPCKKIKPPKVEKNPPRFLSTEEIERLLKTAEGSLLAPMIATGIYAGLRYGELVFLEWSDIDFKLSTITVRNKASENFHTKSRKFRVIPLHEKLRPILLAWKETSLELQKDKETQYCFSNGEGRPYLNNLRREFIIILKKAKIINFRFHDLRHTFASQLAMAGVDIYKISKLLGHSSVIVTQIYAHLVPEKIDINKF
jgi:integrase